ncbi:LANO_0H06040g1_1 [Lachancea nothofagi CBS 11611]|uniref:LANO_0H06040g1_1 n=1 Tax=Lachancea nothofagi CBS 11611 TaxID=1266666 RepID=A0A1G4KLC3_9SACH|nr:LANO_0H06040g1_1 [Lachancea nothofagi CBS 11611]
MNLFAYFVLFVVVIAFILVLPLLSGTFTYKLQKPGAKTSSRNSDSSSLSKRQRFREKMRFSKEQTPLKIQLSHEAHSSSRGNESESDSKVGLKKRTIRKFDSDPNTFDYDIAELMEEDEREEQRERALQFQKFAGKEQETHESLV